MSTEEEKQEKGKTNIGGLVIILLVLIALIWAAISYGNSARGPLPTPRPAAPTTFSVVYSVIGEGTSRASLTIQNETGGTEQMDVALPWSRRFEAEAGQFVYLSAQNDTDSGSIRCEILVNDSRIQTAESDGAFAIASCSGSVGR